MLLCADDFVENGTRSRAKGKWKGTAELELLISLLISQFGDLALKDAEKLKKIKIKIKQTKLNTKFVLTWGCGGKFGLFFFFLTFLCYIMACATWSEVEQAQDKVLFQI